MLSSNVALYLLTFFVSTYAQAGRDSGPVGQITIFSLGPCDPDINDFIFNINLNIDGEGFRTIDFFTELPFEIDDDNVQVNLIADKWVDDEWEKEKFVTSGSFLGLLNKHMSKLWNNFRDQVEPKIEESDVIKAGIYTHKGFHDVTDNIELPSILYGRFRFYFYLLKDDTEFACLMGEAESWE